MEFRLPDVGEGIAESTLLKWHVGAGESIVEDGPFCQIETDKAIVDITAPCTGRVVSLAVGEGTTVRVGSVLAVLDPSGTGRQVGDAPGQKSSATAAVPGVRRDPHPPATRVEALVDPGQPGPVALSASAPPRATLATRRYASELGVDLSRIPGNGPAGRILLDDVKAAAGRVPVTFADAETERVPMTRLRRAIAENMRRSVALIPHATSSFRCDATALGEFRRDCEARFGRRISYTAILIKALVPALQFYPYFNASIDDATHEILLHRAVNVGFATQTDEGLMVPVVKQVHRRALDEIAGAVDALASQARTRTIPLADMRGATITLSNVGSHGGHDVTGRPLVSHPQVAIVAAARIRPEPAVRDGAVCARATLNLTTSYDHRLIDGAYASMFMERFIAAIESTDSLHALM